MSAFSKARGSSSRGRAFSWGVKAVALATTGLLLASCSSGTSTTASSSGALALTVGTLLPQTGSLASLGPAQFAGVALAVQDINAANAGITVTEIDKDSGDTTTNIATQSVTSLIASNVGVIVGAASSSVTLSVLDQVTNSETAMISPANTAAKLTGASAYYFRTAPTDLIQGAVLAQQIIEDGKKNVSLLYSNDDYATGLASTIKAALQNAGVSIASDVEYDPTAANFTTEVSKTLASNPDGLVQIGFDESKTIYQELQTSGFNFANLYGTDGNFGLLTSGSSPDIAGAQYSNPGVNASSDLQSRLLAINPSLTSFSYAAESYDATVVAALAALAGGATDGTTIKDNLIAVTNGDTHVSTFADGAAALAAGKTISYDGLSGTIAFNSDGDRTQGSISLYKYLTGNTYTWESTKAASL